LVILLNIPSISAYMFKNLYVSDWLLRNSTNGELHNLNKEVIQGALRENGLDFTYHTYEGGHAINPEQFRMPLIL